MIVLAVIWMNHPAQKQSYRQPSGPLKFRNGLANSLDGFPGARESLRIWPEQISNCALENTFSYRLGLLFWRQHWPGISAKGSFSLPGLARRLGSLSQEYG